MTIYCFDFILLKTLRCISVLVFLLMFQAGQAQYFNLNFQNFNSSNGLPGNDVECIYQDSRGFIWAGTRFGLSMFDGTNFRNFLHDPLDASSLGGTRIYKIQEDRTGMLWVASENFGLSSIDLKTLKIRNFPIPANQQLEDRYINTLYIDQKGIIWIGAETGVSYFDPYAERYIKVQVESIHADKEIVDFAEDAKGILWAIDYTGYIFYKKPNEKIFRELDHGMPMGYVNDVVEISDKSFLIASSNGIFDLQLHPDPQKSTLKNQQYRIVLHPLPILQLIKVGSCGLPTKTKGFNCITKANQPCKISTNHGFHHSIQEL